MVAKAPRGKILNGPISRSAYNTFLNTYTKFYAFITKRTIVMIFLLCRPTNYKKDTLKQSIHRKKHIINIFV